MKICFFTIVTSWHGLQGGMENHVKSLLEGLAARSHEITVISTRHPSGIEYESKGNIHLHYLSRTTFGSARKGWRKESLKSFLSLNEAHKFDIICSQQAIFPAIPKEIGFTTPIVTFVQGHEGSMFLSEINQFVSLKKNLNHMIKSIFSFVYSYFAWECINFKKSKVIVSPSDEVAKSLLRWFFLNPNKIKIIYNGIDIDTFKPDSTARARILRRYPQLSGKKIILFMSHVTRQKGLHLLIKVIPSLVRQHHNLMILVVGGGDYLEEAKQMSSQLGVSDHMIFTGMLDVGSLPDYINASDIFVLPTLRKEGLPLSILYVMACKKPVITSNIGGNPSVVKNGESGLLVPPANTDKLEKSIALLLRNNELVSRLAENGYESVIANFNLNRMLDSYEGLLEKQIAIKSKF